MSASSANSADDVKKTIWLVLSSFRNDKDIERILHQVHSSAPHTFSRILIVDSQGTGTIPRMVESQKWKNVTYSSYSKNLGSGANLRERLRIAAEGGADYAYALNHDGEFDFQVFTALLNAANSINRLGAVYPLSYLFNAGRYNVTGTRELPLPARLVTNMPKESLLDAFWSSSNGALYSTQPAKSGILPWDAMWMAWEDLEYGWRLHDHGYRQVIACQAVFRDNYEYSLTPIGHVTSKPPWRTYYMMRNLILAIRRNRNRPLYHAVTAFRFMLESGLIVCARRQKWERIRMLCRGLVDGVKGIEENRHSESG